MASIKNLTVQDIKDQFPLRQLHPECPKCQSPLKGMMFVSIKDLMSADIDWYKQNANLRLICAQCEKRIMDNHVWYCENKLTTMHPDENFHLCIKCGILRWKKKRVNGRIIP